MRGVHVEGVDALFAACERAGAGIAFFMLMAHLGGKPPVILGVTRIVVRADFLFTATAVVLQPITGVWLALVVGYPLTSSWIVASLALYALTGGFWLPLAWMQMRMRDLAQEAVDKGAPFGRSYHRLFWIWFAFGFPAFAAVLAIFWLMIVRPELW